MLFQAYLSDIAVTALFGVGYYLFRNKPVQTKKNISNNTKQDVNLKKSLKEKLGLSCDQLIDKTETIEELSLLLKEKIMKLKYNINNINLPNKINPTKVLSHIHCKKLIPNMEIYNYLLEVIVGLNNIESMRILEEELFEDTCPVSIDESTLLGFLKGMKIKSLIYQENLKHAFENNIETENNQDFVVQKSYIENIILEIEKVLRFFSNRYVEMNTIEVFNECLEIMTTPLTSIKVFEYYERNNSMFEENHETYRILLTAIKEKWSLHIYSNSKGIKSICDQSTNKNLCSLFLVSDDSEKEESLINKAFELFNDAASKGLCSQELLHSLFEICVLCNDYEKLNELISLTKLSYTKFLNSETYSLLIKCFEVKEDFETAYSYFEEFKKQRLINKQTISSLTSSSKSVINPKTSLLKTIIQKTIDKEEDNFSLCNSQASTEISSTKLSCSTLEVYSSIIQCAIKTKKTEKIEDLLRECSDVSDNLPESLLVALFSHYKSSKKIIKAIELYELKIVSVKTRFPFSVMVFNSMIDCCVENGKYDVMEGIFNNMNDATKNEFPLPELTSYALMTRGYCKANNHGKVLEFYYYLLYFQNQGEYKIDESLCNSIIDCFARSKDEKNCIKIFNELKRSMKNKISIMTYGIIIKLYVNIDNLDKVLFYFNEICNNTGSSGINELKPSIIIYQLIMKCMIKNRKIESAVELFKDMINNKNIKPDFLIFELLIKNCFEANLIETAFDLIVDACRFEIRLENFLYEAAISAIKNLDSNDLNRKKHLIGLIKAIKSSKVQISRKTADMFNELIVDLKDNVIKNTNSTVTQTNENNGILNIEEIFLKKNQTFIQMNKITSTLIVSNEEELIVFGGNADLLNEDINELRIDVQNIRPFEEEDIGANSRKKINKKNSIINITKQKANDDHCKLIYNSISFPQDISLKNSKSNQTPRNEFYYNETNAKNSNIVDNLFGIRNNNYRNSFPQKKPLKKFNNNHNYKNNNKKSDNYVTSNDQHTVGSLYSSKNVSQYNSSIYNKSNNKQGNSYYNNSQISAFRKSIYD